MGLATLSLLLAAWATAATPAPAGVGDVARLRGDPAPAALTNDTHYLVSNERRLDLLQGDMADRADVYVGVGAGQNYLLAGWARPAYMVLVDFDQDVVDLHGLYIAFLAHARDAEAFEALWHDGSEPAVRRLLAVAVPQPLRRTRLLALYARVHTEIADDLARSRAKLAENGASGYLTEPEQYQRLATLARTGRIIARRGDFTAEGFVAELGETLRRHRARIGALYLSNIEQYFMYSATFRSNIAALPLDDASAVLRTLPAKPAGFEYLVQRGDQLHAWVRIRRVRSVYRIRGMTKELERPASTRVELSGPPSHLLRAPTPL